MTTPWLAHTPNPRARLHLLCFPYSGAPVNLFAQWRIPGVDVLPIVLPGRGPRAAEPLTTSLTDMADDIARDVIPQLPGPFALLGHSMGAWVAHAVATRLEDTASHPERLFIVSAPPPHLSARPFSSLHTLPDDEMADEVIQLGGAPPSMRESIAANVEVIRADATAVAHYRPDRTKLLCPISVIGGTSDPLYWLGDLNLWRETTTGDASIRYLAGGHFIINSQRSKIMRAVATDTGAAVRHADPIAVTGVGLRFPGASTTGELWSLLAEGRTSVAPVPGDRGTHNGRQIMAFGGFLDDVDQFDPTFFEFTTREAHRSDPRLRLLLMATQEALDDAALTRYDIAGPRTGVWIGESHSDYWDLSLSEVDPNMYTLSGGGLKSFLSGRLSHFFDLQGPSLTLDTSCSSSLTAIHAACESLRSGEVDTAFAGGAHLILNPHGGPSLGLAKALSPNGRSAFASSDADGYARSEGVAVVALRRLSDALNDGDPIHAVIEGSSVNANGRSGRNIVTTSVPGQIRMMREALANAGARPSDIGYVEAHGPGTPVGDSVELTALNEVYGRNRRDCLIGSVKTNVGHLEPVAGIAAFLKTMLAVQHGQVPPSLWHKEPNPTIDWDDSALRVPTSLEDWPRDGHRRAAVSSFGLSGANAHVILAAPAAQPHARARHSGRTWNLARYWYTEVSDASRLS